MNKSDTLTLTGGNLLEIQKGLKGIQTKVLLLTSEKIKTDLERTETLIEILEFTVVSRFLIGHALTEIEAHCKSSRPKKAVQKKDGHNGSTNPKEGE